MADREEITELLRAADQAYEAGQVQEAEDLYRQVLARDSGVAAAHSRLGAILAQRGLLTEAEAALDRALALDPEYAPAVSNRGNICFTRGQFAAALEHYRTAARLDPDNPIYRYNLHAAHKKLGQLTEAVAALKQAHRLERARLRTPHGTQRTGRGRLGCASAVATMLIAVLLAWQIIRLD